MTYTWETKPNGQVIVNGILLMPDADEDARFRADVYGRWAPMASSVSAETGTPTAWILGVMARESFGNPNAGSSAGALGLMQLLPQFHLQGVPQSMWFDPLTNMTAGAKYLAKMRAKGSDLVYAAAEYNVGHIQKNPTSVWGLYAQGCPPTAGLPNCYITKVVGFTNLAYEMLGAESPYGFLKTVVGGAALIGGGVLLYKHFTRKA